MAVPVRGPRSRSLASANRAIRPAHSRGAIGERAAGSLTVVGLGFQAARQTTTEARDAIARAERVFYLVGDAVSARWIRRLNPTAVSLHTCYVAGKGREGAYRRMIETMLAPVRSGRRVCAAFYGHPGVFAYPSHEAIRQARSEGFPARMLPGISAEDCLFADLGIDPGRSGCQSFEATDFLVYRRRFDTASSLVLWQIALVGRLDYRWQYRRTGLAQIARYLARFYGGDHEVVLYEASPYLACDPIVLAMTLRDLPKASLDRAMTLYVPPVPRSPDARALRRLGLSTSDLRVVPLCWEGTTSRATDFPLPLEPGPAGPAVLGGSPAAREATDPSSASRRRPDRDGAPSPRGPRR